MEELETTIETGNETPSGTESSEDAFIKGFEEEFGMDQEEKTEEPETEPETKEETEEAESPEKEAESKPEMISFKEAGREFSAPKEAVEAFAKAVGRDAASLIDIYQKGCNYDKLNEKLSEAMKDSAAFERMAAGQHMAKDTLREEILARLNEAELNGVVTRIKNESPGISEEAARELAKFRLASAKPKEEPAKEENTEEHKARLREVEIFQAKHPELGTLPNEVIELWEKSGIPLEKAFEGWHAQNRVSELEKELAEMKTKQKKDEQKLYAKETSPGSATSAAGVTEKDPFLEAFSKDY